MDHPNVASPPKPQASANPLAGWGNDDFLITAEARKLAAAAWPRAFPVLDWPEFRETFERHDALANLAKKRLNRHGGRGALFGALGASALALAPLSPIADIKNILVVLGCLLVVIGGGMAWWHLRGHSGRVKWLLNRMWTERLRQFYFQVFISNFDAVAAAMDDDAKLENFRSMRSGALMAFNDAMEKNLRARSFSQAIEWVANDYDDSRAWAETSWQLNHTRAVSATSDHREMLDYLSHARVGVQELYSRSNLKPHSASQGAMARNVQNYGNILTLVFVASLASAGLALFIGKNTMISDILVAISGVAAAWGLYVRLLDQGMGYSLDTERFELYFEQINLVRQRFDAAGDKVHWKIEALRQLEVYAYRELRQFLKTHLRSRFLG